MDRMPLYINALDFSRMANKYGYTVGYALKNGPNGGDMQDGTEVIDRREVMANIVWKMNDIPTDELSRLLQVCTADPYLSVQYFEPRINGPRTSIFTAEIGPQQVLLYTGSGPVWFNGPVLTLREVQAL